ncbi:MAG: hypothetical protein Q9181_004963 [Wetmoreana brouardii]
MSTLLKPTKDTISGIDITLFPRDKEAHLEIHAEVDISMSVSVLSRPALDQLKLDCEPCEEGTTAQNARGRTYDPVGKLGLQWHKRDIAKPNSETFYVVESATVLVILGASAFPKGDVDTHAGTYPFGLKQQTPGTWLQTPCGHCRVLANPHVRQPEEQKQQAQKKAETEERRAKEKKEQEDREREKRQGK